MKATLAHRAAPFLLTTMLVAAPAFAQSAGSPSGPGSTAPVAVAPGASTAAAPGQMSSGPSGTSRKAMPSNSAAANRQPGDTMQTMVEKRIADLHSRLHITNEQTLQWNQFAQVMRDNAKDMDQSYQQRAHDLGTMSAVDNMKSFAQIEQQRAQDTQKLVPAFQTFYASLTDPQKKTADQLFRNYSAEAQTRRQAAALK